MPLREGRDQHREQRDRREKDDIDFWMAEDPEEVLPQQGIAALRRVEERPAEQPLHLEQQVARDQRREGEQDHHCDDEDVPGVERHQVEPHARRAALQNADDQLDRGGDRRYLDEAEAQHPDVGAKA